MRTAEETNKLLQDTEPERIEIRKAARRVLDAALPTAQKIRLADVLARRNKIIQLLERDIESAARKGLHKLQIPLENAYNGSVELESVNGLVIPELSKLGYGSNIVEERMPTGVDDYRIDYYLDIWWN